MTNGCYVKVPRINYCVYVRNGVCMRRVLQELFDKGVKLEEIRFNFLV